MVFGSVINDSYLLLGLDIHIKYVPRSGAVSGKGFARACARRHCQRFMRGVAFYRGRFVLKRLKQYGFYVFDAVEVSVAARNRSREQRRYLAEVME